LNPQSTGGDPEYLDPPHMHDVGSISTEAPKKDLTRSTSSLGLNGFET
jgi:hypothetical protein